MAKKRAERRGKKNTNTNADADTEGQDLVNLYTSKVDEGEIATAQLTESEIQADSSEGTVVTEAQNVDVEHAEQREEQVSDTVEAEPEADKPVEQVVAETTEAEPETDKSAEQVTTEPKVESAVQTEQAFVAPAPQAQNEQEATLSKDHATFIRPPTDKDNVAKRRKKGFTGKVKAFGMKKLAIIGTVLVVGIGGLVAYSKLHDSLDFYKKMSEQTKLTTGAFRYTIDVRIAEHSEDNTKLEDVMTEAAAGSEDTSDSEEGKKSGYKDVKNAEKADAETVDKEKESKTDNGDNKKTSDWGTANGADSVGGWDYPNYTIVLTGDVTKAEPLEGNLTVNIETNKIKDEFFDMTVKEGKVYFNVGQMRTWLLKSQDSYLISLAEDIPDNVVYVELNGADCDFSSFYAPAGTENADCKGIDTMYNRLRAFANCGIQIMQSNFGNLGMTKLDDRYAVQISGVEKSRAYLSSVESIFAHSGNYFDNYISVLEKNKYATADEIKVMREGKSAFLYNMADVWQAIAPYNTDEDLKALDLNVQAWARKFGKEKKGYYESSYGVSYTKDNYDYLITLSSHIQPTTGKCEAPDKGVVTADKLSDWDISDFLMRTFDYFNVTGISTNTALSDDNCEYVTLMYKDALAKKLNKLYAGNKSFVKLSRYNIDDFIQRYSNISIFSRIATPFDIEMYRHVNEYQKELNEFYGNYTDDLLLNAHEVTSKLNGIDFEISPLMYLNYEDVPVLVYSVNIDNTTGVNGLFDVSAFSAVNSKGEVVADINNIETLQQIYYAATTDIVKPQLTVDAGDKTSVLLFVTLPDVTVDNITLKYAASNSESQTLGLIYGEEKEEVADETVDTVTVDELKAATPKDAKFTDSDYAEMVEKCNTWIASGMDKDIAIESVIAQFVK